MAEENKTPLPEELEKRLIQVLQDVAFFMHEKSGASTITLNVQHVSDALTRQSQTLISGGGLGFNLHAIGDAIKHAVELDKKEFAATDPQKLADDAIERALNAAKKKQAEGGSPTEGGK